MNSAKGSPISSLICAITTSLISASRIGSASFDRLRYWSLIHVAQFGVHIRVQILEHPQHQRFP